MKELVFLIHTTLRDFEEFKNVYSMIETCVIALINKSKEF